MDKKARDLYTENSVLLFDKTANLKNKILKNK